MKILYIHQYFRTPEEGGAIRSYYIAKGLVDRGVGVEMITSHNKPAYEHHIIDGIHVHYLPVFYSNRLNFFSRIRAFIKFCILSIRVAWPLKDINLVYATSTPLTVGLIAIVIKRLKKIPFIFEVRDLWPEAPIQLGIIKNKVLKSATRKLEFAIYKHASCIIALSPGIRAHISRLFPQKEIYEIPNMADVDFFSSSQSPSHENLNNAPFTITYFGALGMVNNVQSLINLAEQSKNFPAIRFNIVGEGACLDHIRKETTCKGIDSIELHEFCNKSDLKEILNKTHASYISFLPNPILEHGSPNKFFDSLAAGKLIILNFKGWLLDLCERHQCGLYVDPDNEGDFIKKITSFLDSPLLLSRYQENARKLAENYFDKDAQVHKIYEIISSFQK